MTIPEIRHFHIDYYLPDTEHKGWHTIWTLETKDVEYAVHKAKEYPTSNPELKWRLFDIDIKRTIWESKESDAYKL